jgi:hypothetical protein
MNDLPRHTLLRIIRQHGRGICDAPKRVEGLLRDLSGAHRREINIIIGALKERVPADLLAAGNTAPREVLLARLAARLRDNLAYTTEAARWGVETWAFALGLVSEAELRERAHAEAAERAQAEAAERAQAEAAERVRRGASSSVRDAEPPAAARNTPPASPPPQATTAAGPRRQPPQASKASPPAPPIVATPPVTSARQPITTHPHAPAPPASRPNVAPPPPARDASRWGSRLRGCLVAVVLLIVITVAAVFIVPAVIMLLKEEQAQPSINDPRAR